MESGEIDRFSEEPTELGGQMVFPLPEECTIVNWDGERLSVRVESSEGMEVEKIGFSFSAERSSLLLDLRENDFAEYKRLMMQFGFWIEATMTSIGAVVAYIEECPEVSMLAGRIIDGTFGLIHRLPIDVFGLAQDEQGRRELSGDVTRLKNLFGEGPGGPGED